MEPALAISRHSEVKIHLPLISAVLVLQISDEKSMEPALAISKLGQGENTSSTDKRRLNTADER